MTDNVNKYAVAQARWLAREFPEFTIETDGVDSVRFEYDEGYHYSTLTFQDAEYEIIITYADGSSRYLCDMTRSIDLTRMVVEGLELLDD